MTYSVIIRSIVQRQLNKLQRSDYKIIISALLALGEDSRPQGVIKLMGSPLWRVRVKDFRIVYSINDEEKLVTVVRVVRRSEDTYKGL